MNNNTTKLHSNFTAARNSNKQTRQPSDLGTEKPQRPLMQSFPPRLFSGKKKIILNFLVRKLSLAGVFSWSRCCILLPMQNVSGAQAHWYNFQCDWFPRQKKHMKKTHWSIPSTQWVTQAICSSSALYQGSCTEVCVSVYDAEVTALAAGLCNHLSVFLFTPSTDNETFSIQVKEKRWGRGRV